VVDRIDKHTINGLYSLDREALGKAGGPPVDQTAAAANWNRFNNATFTTGLNGHGPRGPQL